ncbi:MAG: alpha/beta hydrolase [SAR202 cluster bacterium]|nr:alpha/beta hydrolase [SAR202 cluster bacterium]
MSDIRVEENVVVGQAGDRELQVDVFRPAQLSGPVPGILFLPGGSWLTANRSGIKDRFGIPLARLGYVCVAGEYRVTAESPWPAQIQDVKTIIRWMRANSSELDIDPSAIVVAGKSAGGHLALLAAGTMGVAEFEGDGGNSGVSSEVAATVGVAAVSDISQVIGREDLAPLLGDNPSPELVQSASPVGNVGKDYPPTLLIHGTSDSRVHHSMTMQMYQALENAGIPVDLQLYAGQDHSFDADPQFSRAIVAAIGLFISRHVTRPVTAGAST